MAPDLQFISLLPAGSSSSRDTRPTSRRPTYYLRHFREAGRLLRERQHPFRDARPIIYVTSRRRVAQFARDSTHFVTPDLLLTSLRGGGQKAKQRNGTEPTPTTRHTNRPTHQPTDRPRRQTGRGEGGRNTTRKERKEKREKRRRRATRGRKHSSEVQSRRTELKQIESVA